MIQKLKYRLRYYWRCIARFIGICPTCHTPVNYTTTRRPICPKCGH